MGGRYTMDLKINTIWTFWKSWNIASECKNWYNCKSYKRKIPYRCWENWFTVSHWPICQLHLPLLYTKYQRLYVYCTSDKRYICINIFTNIYIYISYLLQPILYENSIWMNSICYHACLPLYSSQQVLCKVPWTHTTWCITCYVANDYNCGKK